MAIPPAVASAIYAALRWHEVRDSAAVAYRLSFAEIGWSGASFGYLQHDCHTNPDALTVLIQILTNAAVPAVTRGRIVGALRNAAPQCPLSAPDLAITNAAIDSIQGRALVDAIDRVTLDGIIAQCERCITARAPSAISPEALIGMACWINQSGQPTELLTWLRGETTYLGGRPVPPLVPGETVDEAAFFRYYDLIPFVEQNASQGVQMVQAIRFGMASMGAVSAQIVATLPPIPPLVPVSIIKDQENV
jgi:hypothetical protein